MFIVTIDKVLAHWDNLYAQKVNKLGLNLSDFSDHFL